jgi:hypothetical protein
MGRDRWQIIIAQIARLREPFEGCRISEFQLIGDSSFLELVLASSDSRRSFGREVYLPDVAQPSPLIRLRLSAPFLS